MYPAKRRSRVETPARTGTVRLCQTECSPRAISVFPSSRNLRLLRGSVLFRPPPDHRSNAGQRLAPCRKGCLHRSRWAGTGGASPHPASRLKIIVLRRLCLTTDQRPQTLPLDPLVAADIAMAMWFELTTKIGIGDYGKRRRHLFHRRQLSHQHPQGVAGPHRDGAAMRLWLTVRTPASMPASAPAARHRGWWSICSACH